MSAADGAARAGTYGVASSTLASSERTSSGNATTTGPGRPDAAVWNARAVASGNWAGLLDLERELRHRAESLAVVELLECLPAPVLERHLTDEEDQRRGVLKGCVDAGGSMSRSGRTRDEADAGPAGQLSVRLGHVRGAGLVPGYHEPDRRVP